MLTISKRTIRRAATWAVGYFVSGMCCILPTLHAAAVTHSAQQQLHQLLTSYTTYQASYLQRTYNAQGKVMADNHGKTYIQRPGRFRWESSKPTSQILIANGQLLWVYDVDLQQATQRKLNQQNDTLAQLMTGNPSKILSQYRVSLTSNKPKASSTLSFTLVPRNKDAGLFKKLQLYFKANSLQRLQMLNHLDEYTTIAFSAVKLNVHLPARLFIFKPPKGVDVLKQL